MRSLQALYQRSRWRDWHFVHLPLGLVLSLALLVAVARAPLLHATSASDDWMNARIDPEIAREMLPPIQTRQERRTEEAPSDAPEKAGKQKGEDAATEMRTAEMIPSAVVPPRAEDRRASAERSEAPTAEASMRAVRPRAPAPVTSGIAPAEVAQHATLNFIPALYVTQNAPELRAIDARYPEDARRHGVEGPVILEFRVDTDGRAYDIEVLKPLHPACDEEAVRAVKHARFAPAERNGRDVPALTRLVIRFRMHRF